MKFSAIAYDTNSGKPRKMESIRWISLDSNGRPERISAQNGVQYRDFKLNVDLEDESNQIHR